MTRLQMFRAVHQALETRPQGLIAGKLISKQGRHCALGVAVQDHRLSYDQASGSPWEITRVYLFGRPARDPAIEIAHKNDTFLGTPSQRYGFMLNWLGNEIAKMEEAQGTPLPVPAWMRGVARPKSRV